MPRSYKLLQKLGEGAFGEVHLAEMRDEDEGFVQTLAVKWLHPHYSQDAHLASRLRDEARLLALLNHDHIVRVHGLTRIDGRLAVLMEPVQGVDLAEVAREVVPPVAALEVVAAVADALAAAWEAHPPGSTGPLRVVHRDIKPSNVMVTPRGAVKVMDFGVARATFDSREAKTKSQQFGTARYMAPERWLEGVSEAPSDIYSLGITLIELVSGTEVERMRLSSKAFAEDLEAALDRLEGWPPIRELAAKMCALDPEERPRASEVAELARELAAELDGPNLRTWAAERCVREAVASNPSPTVVAEDDSGDTFAVTGPFGGLTATAPATMANPPAPASGDLSATLARRPWFWPAVFTVVGLAGMAGVFLGPTFRGTPATVSDPVAPVAAPGPSTSAPEPAGRDVLDLADFEEPVPPRDDDFFRALVESKEAEDAMDETTSAAFERALEPSAVPAVPVPPRPDPEPVVEPKPAPAVTGSVTFVLEPPELEAETVAGSVRTRRAVQLPVGPQVVHVSGPGAEWECTVPVREGHAQYVVRGADQTCVASR